LNPGGVIICVTVKKVNYRIAPAGSPVIRWKIDGISHLLAKNLAGELQSFQNLPGRLGLSGSKVKAATGPPPPETKISAFPSG